MLANAMREDLICAPFILWTPLSSTVREPGVSLSNGGQVRCGEPHGALPCAITSVAWWSIRTKQKEQNLGTVTSAEAMLADRDS
jgi:hypothetical protein